MTRPRCFSILVLLLALAPQLKAQNKEPDSPAQTIAQLSKSAAQAFERKEYERAESDYRKIIAISLDQLGAIYNNLSDYKLAERAYREGTGISSTAFVRYLLGLGIVYLRTGRYDEGIAEVEKIVSVDILNPEARQLLGKLHFMKGEFDIASQELDRAYKADPKNARVAYTLALAYLRQKRLEEAQSIFAQMAATVGDTPRFHLLIGRALRETGYADEAVKEFKKAVEIDPRTPRVHYYLGLTYLMQEGGAAFPRAREEFEAEVKNSPNDYLANFFLGVVAARSRDYPVAVTHLRKAIERMTTNPDAYLYLGMSLFQSGDNAGSIPLLKKSLELTTDPSRNGYQAANAHFILGQALRKAGQNEEALEHLKQSQELKALKTRDQSNQGRIVTGDEGLEALGITDVSKIPASVEPAIVLDMEPVDPQTRKALESGADFYRKTAGLGYQSLARLLVDRADFKKAARYLGNAAGWDDTIPDIYYNLGIAALRAEEPALAGVALSEAAKRYPAHRNQVMPLLANLAIQLVDRRLSDEALTVTETLIQSNPGVPDLYLLRGRALAQKGKWDDALAAFQQALAKNPSLPEAHYYAGTVLVRRGEMDKAAEEFDKELALNPRHPQAMYHKAFVLVSQRKMEEAVPLLERVIALEPNYGEPYYQLGKALLEKNETLRAIANLETAASLKPDAYYIQYQLSRAYSKAQRRDDAQQALARYHVLKKQQEEDRARRNEAATLEESGEN